MHRLLSSLLVLLLGAWPSRPAAGHHRSRSGRPRRGARRPDDAQDPVEAPERALTQGAHHWPGELVITAGERRRVVHGRWRFTHDPLQRAQAAGVAGRLSLDPAYAEGWETQLEALLTLQVPGARLQVREADTQGCRLLELRAPTRPETVVHLDRAALAQLFGDDAEDTRLELRVFG
jgi:hypothetical protein